MQLLLQGLRRGAALINTQLQQGGGCNCYFKDFDAALLSLTPYFSRVGGMRAVNLNRFNGLSG
jgi:hypothetical protein